MQPHHLALLLLAGSAHALNNGLGRLPGMGWNSDYCTRCHNSRGSNGFGNETFIRSIGDYLHTSGLQTLGYKYVNMDASWDTAARDPTTGDLVPDPKLWPSGIETTIDYLHSLELGFGLYGDKGTKEYVSIDAFGSCSNHKHPESHPTSHAPALKSSISLYSVLIASRHARWMPSEDTLQ